MLTLLLLVVSASAGAPTAVPEPGKALPEDAPKNAASYLIPAAEILGVYGGFIAANYLLFPHEEWSHVTPRSVRANLRGPWVVDQDDFATNQIGHPYQGSLYFTAARSNGLSFWESFLYTAAGSLLWEVGGEAEPPSINDQITTTFAGALFGEVLYRVWDELIGPPGEQTNLLRHLAAAPLAPVGSLNHYAFKRRASFARTFLFHRLWVGSSYAGSIRDQSGERTELLGFGRQLSLGVGLTQGFPGTSEDLDYGPFDHFDLRFEASFPTTPYVGLFIRGLVFGTGFQPKPWAHGLVGLFGSYDFSTLPLLRVSSSAFGPGLALNCDLGGGVTLQGTMLIAGVFFGGAGAITANSGDRDFRAGGGLQSVTDLRLLLRDAGSLQAGVRNYAIRGYEGAPGTELISYGWVGSELRVVGRHAVGVEVQLSTRLATQPGQPDLSHAGSLFRVYYALLGDPFSGAPRRE